MKHYAASAGAGPSRSLGWIGIAAALMLAASAARAEGLGGAEGVMERIYGPFAPVVWSLASSLLHTAMIGAVALPFQALLPGIRRPVKLLTYEFWLDVIYSCQGVWITMLSFFVAVGWVVNTAYGGRASWFPALAELPYVVQVVIAVWAFDFLVYWRHRWEHTFSALWSFHAVHHTAEKVDFLTTTRLHPFELALGSMFNAAVIKTGLDPAAVAVGFGFYLNYNYFIHTNVRIRFHGFLKYVLVSPFMHQWHHANDAEAAGKNVGVVFAWNDWLFKTAYHPVHWPSDFGLAAPPAERVGQSYMRQLLYPLQFLVARASAWRAVRAGG
jgi:sterol desaturase/sphingolipid hydroxylase (fatty acid hydroxylase superfamily)